MDRHAGTHVWVTISAGVLTATEKEVRFSPAYIHSLHAVFTPRVQPKTLLMSVPARLTLALTPKLQLNDGIS